MARTPQIAPMAGTAPLGKASGRVIADWASHETPTLDRLMAAGVVRWNAEAHEYRGRAADGVEVSVGYDADAAETYLKAHPTPDTW